MYYLLIIAAISLCFSCAVYKIGTNDLAFGLRRQTERISTNFPVFTGSPYLRAGNELQAGKRHLIGQLVSFNILILSGAGVASYALARRTLTPIEAAHDRQKRFTADVSHELRTPLTALKMEAEVALLDPAATTTDLRAVLISNVEEVEKLTNLVSNLLRLGQLDDAERATLLHSLSISDIVKQAVTQVQPVASGRSIIISSTLAPGLTVLGEQGTLIQLFVILIENAVKYSPKNNEVMVTVQPYQNLAKVTISDSGKGIAKADLEHVFERFYRADAARTNSEVNGFGLGLSIAKLIADSNNATISLTSRSGKGTTATVFMPIVDPPKA